MVLQDIASLASLMILGILLLKYEKRKEDTNLENFVFTYEYFISYTTLYL